MLFNLKTLNIDIIGLLTNNYETIFQNESDFRSEYLFKGADRKGSVLKKRSVLTRADCLKTLKGKRIGPVYTPEKKDCFFSGDAY